MVEACNLHVGTNVVPMPFHLSHRVITQIIQNVRFMHVVMLSSELVPLIQFQDLKVLFQTRISPMKIQLKSE
jgi:hypothetical protein